MSAFISRIKQWLQYENLLNSDLNAEFNNIIDTLGADTISGANSTGGTVPTVPAMQAQEDPGNVGSEVLSTTIQEDIKQIRYQLDQIIGGAEWYVPPPASLTTLNGEISGLNPQAPNRIVSGAVDANLQPMFLTPDGVTNRVNLLGGTTPLITYIDDVLTEFNTNINLTGLTLGPSSANTATITDASLSSGQATKWQGERNTIIQLTGLGANVLARAGTYCAFLHGSEVFIGELFNTATTGSVTFTNATPTVVTYNSHGLITNDQVYFTGGSLPTGVSAGTANIYFVTVVDANTLKISTTAGGSFVATSSAGSGTCNVLKTIGIRNCYRGWFFNSSNAAIARTTLANLDSVTLLQLTWVFATNNSSTLVLDVTYNRPTTSVTTPATPAIGDYWLDMTAGQWKKYSGSSFVTTTAILVGVCVQDTTKTLAARSFDFSNAYSMLNTFEVEYFSTTQVRGSKLSDKISVYGTGIKYDYDRVIWDVTTNLDTGVTLTASTNYYCYITPAGLQVISNQAPNQRKYDLLGDYHPNKPWRCVATFQTTAGSVVSPSGVIYWDYHQAVLPYQFITGGDAESTSQIAQSTIVGSNIANSTITQRSMAPLSVGTSELIAGSVTYAKLAEATKATSDWSTTSSSLTSLTAISGGTVTITASDSRPILISLSPLGSGTECTVSVSNSSSGTPHGILRVDAGVNTYLLGYSVGFGASFPVGNSWLAFPAPGAFTVTMYIYNIAAGTGTNSIQIIAGTLSVTQL